MTGLLLKWTFLILTLGLSTPLIFAGQEPEVADVVSAVATPVAVGDLSISENYDDGITYTTQTGAGGRGISSSGNYDLYVSTGDLNALSNIAASPVIISTFNGALTRIPQSITFKKSQACGCDIEAQQNTCQLLRARYALSKFINAENFQDKEAKLHYNRIFGNLKQSHFRKKLEAPIRKLLKNTWGVASERFIHSQKMISAWQAYENIIREASDDYLKNPPVALLAYKHFFAVVAEQKNNLKSHRSLKKKKLYSQR